MRIEFSARAWMLSAATGLVILPSFGIDVTAETQAAEVDSSGEPRMLIERPATRDAISSSKPARSLFPGLFSGRNAEPSIQLPPRDPSDTRSDVQRHLDELYRREGREAPTLDIGQTPGTGLSQSIPQLPQSTPAQASNSGPVRQVASNPFKRFFQKITPFGRSRDVNDERPDHVEPLPMTARQEQLRIQQAPVARPQPKPVREPMPIPTISSKSTTRPALPALGQLVPPPPAPAEAVAETSAPFELPAVPEAAAEVKQEIEISANKLPEFLPAVELKPDSVPQILSTELSSEPVGSEAAAVASAPASDELLGNPFPEVSESEADGVSVIVKPAVAAKKESSEKSSPFNGLKLDTEDVSKAANAVQQTAADSVPLPQLPDLPAPAELAAPGNATQAGRLPEITPADLPAPKASGSGKEAHGDKLKMIAERSELTGLKGFCPVALTDSRELKDARPQFQSEFNGKVYNLSSAEAKEKFESDPAKYAPAAGGQDVVLAANEETDSEGSLDRAVWYRNKLYLFSTRASHEEFVASPAKFAVDIPEID